MIAGVDTKAAARGKLNKPTVDFTSKNRFQAIQDAEASRGEASEIRWILNATGAKSELNAVPKTQQENRDDQVCGMVFNMTNAKRMLASVDRIVQAGNIVHFARGEGDSYIENIKTGNKIILEKLNGVYCMKVWVVWASRKMKCSIVIDSGASECVMPKDWFPELEEMKAKKGIRFAAADGGDLGNYGRKLIEFRPVFSRRA